MQRKLHLRVCVLRALEKVYEFLGDYWHGNPMVYAVDNVNPTKQKAHGRPVRCDGGGGQADALIPVMSQWLQSTDDSVLGKSSSSFIQVLSLPPFLLTHAHDAVAALATVTAASVESLRTEAVAGCKLYLVFTVGFSTCGSVDAVLRTCLGWASGWRLISGLLFYIIGDSW